MHDNVVYKETGYDEAEYKKEIIEDWHKYVSLCSQVVFGSNENGRYCFGSSEVTELVPLSVPNQPLSRASLLAQIDEDTKKTEVDS